MYALHESANYVVTHHWIGTFRVGNCKLPCSPHTLSLNPHAPMVFTRSQHLELCLDIYSHVLRLHRLFPWPLLLHAPGDNRGGNNTIRICRDTECGSKRRIQRKFQFETEGEVKGGVEVLSLDILVIISITSFNHHVIIAYATTAKNTQAQSNARSVGREKTLAIGRKGHELVREGT